MKTVVPDTPAILVSDAYSTASRWGRLYGSAESLAIAEYASEHEGLCVVVAPSTSELLQLEIELQFYAGAKTPVHVLGDWETLTYDRVSPHQDIISQRIRTLYSLGDAKRGILLLTAAALMQRLPPRSFLDQHALMLRTGDTLALADFRVRLVEAGYRLVSLVEEPG